MKSHVVVIFKINNLCFNTDIFSYILAEKGTIDYFTLAS